MSKRKIFFFSKSLNEHALIYSNLRNSSEILDNVIAKHCKHQAESFFAMNSNLFSKLNNCVPVLIHETIKKFVDRCLSQ